ALWIVPTFSSDNLEDLPPATSNTNLLGVAEAREKARSGLRRGTPEVILPLGFEATKIWAPAILTLSAFVCRTPCQWKAIEPQFERFRQRHACGLEALALRRTYGGRRSGSLVAIAESIFRSIRAGSHDLTKALHLDRLSPEMKEAANRRRLQLEGLREAASQELDDRMDARHYGAKKVPSAIIVTKADESWL
ncbi:MAG TPA: hypothetical protein VGH33_01385, partial [Isosphaeraceae bacterium]